MEGLKEEWNLAPPDHCKRDAEAERLEPVDRGSQRPGPRLAEVVRVLPEYPQRTVGGTPRVLHGLAARLAV